MRSQGIVFYSAGFGSTPASLRGGKAPVCSRGAQKKRFAANASHDDSPAHVAVETRGHVMCCPRVHSPKIKHTHTHKHTSVNSPLSSNGCACMESEPVAVGPMAPSKSCKLWMEFFQWSKVWTLCVCCNQHSPRGDVLCRPPDGWRHATGNWNLIRKTRRGKTSCCVFFFCFLFF